MASKIHLHRKGELKEQLTEHLLLIIQQVVTRHRVTQSDLKKRAERDERKRANLSWKKWNSEREGGEGNKKGKSGIERMRDRKRKREKRERKINKKESEVHGGRKERTGIETCTEI